MPWIRPAAGSAACYGQSALTPVLQLDVHERVEQQTRKESDREARCNEDSQDAEIQKA